MVDIKLSKVCQNHQKLNKRLKCRLCKNVGNIWNYNATDSLIQNITRIASLSPLIKLEYFELKTLENTLIFARQFLKSDSVFHTLYL